MSCYSTLSVGYSHNHAGYLYKSSALIFSISAQGAAQAIEDGAVLGHLFAKVPTRETRRSIPDILKIYERLRKERTAKVVRKSADFRVVFHMEDGPLQEERDRVLLEETPVEGFPFLFADPSIQHFLFDYDVAREVDEAWGAFEGRPQLCSL